MAPRPPPPLLAQSIPSSSFEFGIEGNRFDGPALENRITVRSPHEFVLYSTVDAWCSAICLWVFWVAQPPDLNFLGILKYLTNTQ